MALKGRHKAGTSIIQFFYISNFSIFIEFGLVKCYWVFLYDDIYLYEGLGKFFLFSVPDRFDYYKVQMPWGCKIKDGQKEVITNYQQLNVTYWCLVFRGQEWIIFSILP